jgi:hypothetical protein
MERSLDTTCETPPANESRINPRFGESPHGGTEIPKTFLADDRSPGDPQTPGDGRIPRRLKKLHTAPPRLRPRKMAGHPHALRNAPPNRPSDSNPVPCSARECPFADGSSVSAPSLNCHRPMTCVPAASSPVYSVFHDSEN